MGMVLQCFERIGAGYCPHVQNQPVGSLEQDSLFCFRRNLLQNDRKIDGKYNLIDELDTHMPDLKKT
jgi:hypothetical protein